MEDRVRVASCFLVIFCILFGCVNLQTTEDVLTQETDNTKLAAESEVETELDKTETVIKNEEKSKITSDGEHKKREDSILSLKDILNRVMTLDPFVDGMSDTDTGEAKKEENSEDQPEVSELAKNLENNTEILDTNSTNKNTTKTKKITCIGRNTTDGLDGVVKVINSTFLLQRLTFKNESEGNCVLVMFYAPWCMFCAKTAPHFNAVARAFPQLETVAVDAVQLNSLNARFGTVAVPNIVIFHNSKAVARFHHNQERNFTNIVNFVSNITGLQPLSTVNVTDLDFEGPLSSTPSQEPDFLLWASWLFVIVFSMVLFGRSVMGKRLWTNLQNLGAAEHLHID